MTLIYQGRAFRRKHGVSLKALAAGTGLRKATLIDLEHGRRLPEGATLDALVAFFRERGIDCTPNDLLEYEPSPP